MQVFFLLIIVLLFRFWFIIEWFVSSMKMFEMVGLLGILDDGVGIPLVMYDLKIHICWV